MTRVWVHAADTGRFEGNSLSKILFVEVGTKTNFST